MVISANTVATDEDEVLRQQIVDARQQLSGLETDLTGIDAELDGLGEQRETYELLEQACGTLEKLDALGAAKLFWGESTEKPTDEHIRQARNRARSYLGRIHEIQRRRESVVDRIKQGQEVLDILEADLFEFELAEEARKQEWVVEREPVFEARPTIMPWQGTDDDRRLRKSLLTSLLVALVIGAIIPMIDLPLPDLELLPEVPDRFARLIEQVPPPPPPPPQEVVEETPPEEAVEPEPETEPETVAEEEPEVVPEVQEEPAPTVAEEPAPEREVRSAGILAFSDNFANLAESRPSAQLGAQARINDAGEAAVGRTERAMVTSQAPGSSGGINLASLSRNVGGSGGAGQQIDGVQVTRVASSIGVSGSGDRPTSAGAAAGRTDEEIQIVFDRYKSALYRLYNRELRNDPTLRGQVVLKLTIEPDGSVSFCEVQSSGLGAPMLEQQIVERVQSFDFGAKEGITAVTILYPIDFLPAA
jgi:TonB family protein